MAATLAQVSFSICTSNRDFSLSSPARISVRNAVAVSARCAPIRNSFATAGSSLLIRKNYCQKKFQRKATSVSIRCEQSTKGGNSLDIWLGRMAMVGFAAAVSVEVATGKGLLENFGLTSPLPTVALGVTALVGILTAIFIFQSASKS